MEREPGGTIARHQPQHSVSADAQAAHPRDADRLSDRGRDAETRRMAPGDAQAAGVHDPAARGRFAWALSGSGHMLEESLALAARLPDVDLFLSAAAEEV